jgi:hypothetical protein
VLEEGIFHFTFKQAVEGVFFVMANVLGVILYKDISKRVVGDFKF